MINLLKMKNQKEREAHQKKMKDKIEFKTVSHGGFNFSTDKLAFGFEGTIPEVKSFDATNAISTFFNQKKIKEFKPNLYKHDNPFKPSHPPKEVLIFKN